MKHLNLFETHFVEQLQLKDLHGYGNARYIRSWQKNYLAEKLGRNGQGARESSSRVLRQENEYGLEVVDLAKDPLAAGPLAGATTRNSKPDKVKSAANLIDARFRTFILMLNCGRLNCGCHSRCQQEIWVLSGM